MTVDIANQQKMYKLLGKTVIFAEVPIAQMNHIANPNLIYPGQVLIIQTTR